MARAYGLIQDFTVGEPFLTEAGYFSNNPKTELYIYLNCSPEIANYFETTLKSNLPANVKNPVLDLIYTSAWKGKVSGKAKYYHGFKNWGLLSWNPTKFEFKTISRDKELENEKYQSDKIEQLKENNELENLSAF
jgi:hypothetical protein